MGDREILSPYPKASPYVWRGKAPYKRGDLTWVIADISADVRPSRSSVLLWLLHLMCAFQREGASELWMSSSAMSAGCRWPRDAR